MNEIIKKISSYNLFNYLLPGVIFSVLVEKFTDYSLAQEDLLVGAFLYYFVGLVISRFGSILIEPLLKKVGLIKFADYKNFVKACKTDEKIETLSEQNNVYRTIISMLVFFLLVRFYNLLSVQCELLETYKEPIFLISLLALFLASYRKQTSYISSRVSISKK